MKLSDLPLTNLQATALVRWLDSIVTPEERAEAQRNENIAIDLYEKRYAATARAAEQTAEQDGPTTIRPYLQARAAWEAFTTCEGWLSPYDEMFDRYYYNALDRGGSDYAEFQEAWENAYTAMIEKMREERNK